MGRSPLNGITEDRSKNGDIQIYVIFQYQGKRYPKKNFTKLFGCKTREEASSRLAEVKVEISKGRDPFSIPKITLNDFFEAMVKENVETGLWRPSTELMNVYFYNKYLRLKIGYKAPSKITKEDLKNILVKDMSHLQDETKIQLRKVLSPIFKEAIAQKLMFDDLSLILPSSSNVIREHLETRTLDDVAIVGKKLYRAIPYYVAHKGSQREEVINFYMFVLLTARRVGEVRQLRREDCYIEERLAVSPASITKTKISYKFPLPDEVIPYIQNIKTGLLFPTISKSSIDKTWNRIVKLAQVRNFADKVITAHDTRRFLMAIMIEDLDIRESVADACLNHKQKEVIKHYHKPKYKDIENAYKNYWNFLRDPYFSFEPLPREKKKKRTVKEYKALKAGGWERYVPKAERRDPNNQHYRK